MTAFISSLGAIVMAVTAFFAGDPVELRAQIEGEQSAKEPATVGGEARGSLYIRSDTDRTTVVSPRVRYRQELRTPRRVLDITYALDAWSSASVDIRSAATARVTEVRHEGDIGFTNTIGAGQIAVGYRLSYEPDYTSNAIRLSAQRELLQRTITLGARLYGALDKVGRAGDELFSELLLSSGALLSAGFVLTKSTVALVNYELRALRGYQASPYRFVPIGGADLATGGCALGSELCLPEEVPRSRIRQAMVGRIRQALGRRISVGALYRLYTDSWALRSHTGEVDLRLRLAAGPMLSLEYRAYAQSGASFYRSMYLIQGPTRFFTRDRELSSLGNHRLALRAQTSHRLRRGTIDAGAFLAGSRLDYDDFIGLSQVYAIELALSVGGTF